MSDDQKLQFKDTMTDLTTEFFVSSRDFNGLPLARFIETGVFPKQVFYETLSELISEQRIIAMFDSHCGNPHILRIAPLPPTEQIARLRDANPHHVCLYPTADQVRTKRDLSEFDDRPFTKRLWEVEPQLTPLFFNLSVLDRYFNDPRYIFDFEDNHGSISVREKHHVSGDIEERDNVFLQTFGTGYDQDMNRVVLAYLCYVSMLTPEHQQHWYSHLCTKQCRPNGDYNNATLYGVWPKYVSVYTAFLREQAEINKLCAAIGKPLFFLKTFEHDRPKGFHLMLLPTRSRFDDFTLLLDKLVSDNINKSFFEDDIVMFDKVEHEDGTFERKYHGTLSLLENWFTKYYRVPGDLNAIADAMKPLRRLRKLRQTPAHLIKEDEYEMKYAKEQDELISGAYYCIKFLRMILMKHPVAKDYKMPSWMKEDNIVLY